MQSFRRAGPPPGFDMMDDTAWHRDNNTPEWRGYDHLISRWKPSSTNRAKWEVAERNWKLDEEIRIDFKQFLWEVGPRPSEKHLVHMINPILGIFTFGNIKWMDNVERRARRIMAHTYPSYFSLIGTEAEQLYINQLESIHRKVIEKKERRAKAREMRIMLND